MFKSVSRIVALILAVAFAGEWYENTIAEELMKIRQQAVETQLRELKAALAKQAEPINHYQIIQGPDPSIDIEHPVPALYKIDTLTGETYQLEALHSTDSKGQKYISVGWEPISNEDPSTQLQKLMASVK
jgi:hypothetical protein